MKSKLKLGEPIDFPLQKEDMPLMNAIVSLSSLEVLPEPPKDAHIELFNHLQAGFCFELMWVLKNRLKLWTKADYPFNTLDCLAHESGGKVMIALLNLCEAVLDYGLIKLPYSPLGLWYRVQLERKTVSFGKTFFSKKTKQEMLKSQRRVIAQLAAWENPYKADDPIPHRNSNFNLFSAAIAIGKPQPYDNNQLERKRKEFRVEAWQPLLKALREHVRNLDKGVKAEGSTQKASFKAFQIQGDSLIAVIDGKQFEVIDSPPKKNLSNRGVKTNITLNQ
jgi:hypothetical protein